MGNIKTQYAKNMSKDELRQLKDVVVQQYPSVLHTTSNNDVSIENCLLSLTLDGKLTKVHQLDINSTLLRIRTIALPRKDVSVFQSPAIRLNPLIANRKECDWMWIEAYDAIKFPDIMPIIAIMVVESNNIPTFIDAIKLYMGLYTEQVPEDEELTQSDRSLKLTDPSLIFNGPIPNDRLNLNENLPYLDGSKIKNRLLRFNNDALAICAPHGILSFPYNEFTTEMIANILLSPYCLFIRKCVDGLR